MQDDDGNRQRNKVLLKGKISIDRDEYVEMLRRECQKLAVLDRGPSHLTSSLDLVPDNVTRQAPIHTFVEKHPHNVDSTSRSFASSRKAMTCARGTDGKPSRKASIDSPASR